MESLGELGVNICRNRLQIGLFKPEASANVNNPPEPAEAQCGYLIIKQILLWASLRREDLGEGTENSPRLQSCRPLLAGSS